MRYGFDYLTSGGWSGNWSELQFVEDTTVTLTTLEGEYSSVAFVSGAKLVGNFIGIVVVSGSVIAYRRGTVGATATIDADFQAVLNRGTTLGYSLPTGTAYTAGNQLVKDLKAAGIWSKLDLFYVFATNGDSDFATINWIAPASFQATKVNAPTFISNQGFKGDGISSNLETNWIPSTDGVNYQLDNASYGYYMFDLSTGVGANQNIFADGSVAFLRSSTPPRVYMNSSSFNTLSSFVWNKIQFAHASRTSSTNVNVFSDNLLVDNVSQTSLSVPSTEFYALRSSNQYTDAGVSMGFAGSDLSSLNAQFYNAWINYLNAL